MRKEKIQVYAVVRIDHFGTGDEAIRIKEIVPTAEQAISEVERLNRLNGKKRCHYFWLTTRYFPGSETSETTN